MFNMLSISDKSVAAAWCIPATPHCKQGEPGVPADGWERRQYILFLPYLAFLCTLQKAYSLQTTAFLAWWNPTSSIRRHEVDSFARS